MGVLSLLGGSGGELLGWRRWCAFLNFDDSVFGFAKLMVRGRFEEIDGIYMTRCGGYSLEAVNGRGALCE
jgi:hypothetical protein